jgi:PAS domain S-box-containing protein
MSPPPGARWRPSPEARVALAYTVAASAWVFLSDRLVEALGAAGGAEDAWAVATVKGLVFVAFTGAVLWTLLRAAGRRERDAARRLAASEHHYRAAVEESPDAVVVQASERIAYANPSAAALFGARDAAELVGRPILDLIDPSEHATLRTPSAPLPVKRLRRMRRLDGTLLLGEVAVRSYELPGSSPALLVSVRDVTEAWRLQEELARVNGALRMLGRCNEAVVRAGSEAELLSEVCRVVVEEGGYRFAWIGRAEHDEARSLRPIARFGEGGEDPLGPFGLRLTWAARGDGLGPEGTALRSGEPCFSPDLRADARFQPFAARGVGAAVALPIPIDGAPTYVLSFYAAERRDLDAGTVQVLRQLAEDLRHGLASLRTRAVLTGFLEHAPVPMFARTLDGRYVFVGKGWEEAFGRRHADVVGRLVDEAFPGGRHPEIEAIDRRVIETRAAVRAEHALDLEGCRRVFDLVEFPLLDAEGKISAICGFAREVTEQRATERALAAEREFLGSVLDHAGLLVGVVDREGRIVRANREFERLTGFAPHELVGHAFADRLLAPDERQAVASVLARVLEAQAPVTFTNHLVTRSGERRTLEWVATVMRDEDGRPTHVVGIGRDVTERRRIAAALAESEVRYRQLVESSPAGIGIVQDDRFVFVNQAMVRLAGATGPEDLVGRPVHDLRLDRTRAEAEERLRAVLAGAAPTAYETEYRRLDGTRWAAELALSAITLGGRPAVLCIAVDATERRDAQRRLAESREQLRALAARIQGVREEEKARIARDLHDELGQLVTGLKMDLRWMERRVGELPDSEATHALLDRAVAASELADLTVSTVQRLASDLRPGALDRLGLGAALRQEGRAFEARTGVRCEVALDDGLPPLSNDLATALYRIAQEAMTNVARHAGAARVRIELERAEGARAVRLRVEDDGRGIAPAEVARPDALGLVGMRERAAALGGAVRIEASAPGGTRVTAELPLEAARESA